MSLSDVVGMVPSGGVARRVIGILAARANQAVPADRLADLVWPESLPRSGNSLQAHISRWRKVFGAHRITFGPGGYTLLLDSKELDALEFEMLARDAAGSRTAGDFTKAVETYDLALALWQGPAFLELADDCVGARREELDLLRDRLCLDRLETLCDLGAHDRALPEAVRLSAADPWNEPLHKVLALTHYRRGDQVAALQVLNELRARLRNDLGLDPSPALQELYGRILRHDVAAAPKAREFASGTSSGELVERERELAHLTGLLEGVVRGSGGTIALVTGDPGIGKSHLVEHLDRLIRREGDVDVVWARSYPDASDRTGGPWLSVLAALGQALEGDQVAERTDGSDLAERVVSAVARRCVLVVLDDLHWADPVSIDVLDRLSLRLDQARLAVVALCRTHHTDDHLARTVAGMTRRRGVHVLQLNGLDRPAVADLISRRHGPVPDWLAERLTQSTGGNPYHVLETVAALAARGPLSDLGPEEPWPLAAGVRDVMRQRLDQLPEMTGRVLRMAALAGDVLDTGQLVRASDLDGPALADALAPALSARLLVRTETGIRFAHSLGRDAVAGLVDAGDALRMHRRLGDALAGRSGNSASLVRAADHLATAASLDGATAVRAVDLDRNLATAALRQGRHAEAERHLRRALISASHADDLAAPVAVELEISLAETLQRRGNLEQAMMVYRQAADLAEEAGDTASLARSALGHEECSLHARRHRGGADDISRLLIDRALLLASGDDSLRAELLAARGQALAFSGLWTQADAAGREAVATARGAGDDQLLARTLLRQIPLLEAAGELPQRIAVAGEAAELARAAHADELALEAWCALVPELMRAGQIDDCQDTIDRIERLVEIYDNHLHRWKVPMWRAALALGAGRHDEAAVLIADFRSAGERYGYADTMRVHAFQSVLLALGTDQPSTARAILATVEHDAAFEPWEAARLMVAHLSGDATAARMCLVRLAARRFRLSQPFASVQTFCACLAAEAVAASGDKTSAALLIELIEPAAGHNQVLGSGAAMLGDPARHLGLLAEALGDRTRALDLHGAAERRNSSWGLLPAAERSRDALQQMTSVVRW